MRELGAAIADLTPHDHRHRRSRRLRQGHAREAACRRISACRISIPGCSTARWPARSSTGAALTTTRRRPRGRRTLDLEQLGDPRLRERPMGERGLDRLGLPAGARRAAGLPAAASPPSRRRRARRARHRHGRVPTRRGEALHHRGAGGARPPPPLELLARGEPADYEKILADIRRRDAARHEPQRRASQAGRGRGHPRHDGSLTPRRPSGRRSIVGRRAPPPMSAEARDVTLRQPEKLPHFRNRSAPERRHAMVWHVRLAAFGGR